MGSVGIRRCMWGERLYTQCLLPRSQRLLWMSSSAFLALRSKSSDSELPGSKPRTVSPSRHLDLRSSVSQCPSERAKEWPVHVVVPELVTLPVELHDPRLYTA